MNSYFANISTSSSIPLSIVILTVQGRLDTNLLVVYNHNIICNHGYHG